MQKGTVEIIAADDSHYPVIRGIALRTWPVTFARILSQAQIDYMLNWLYTEASLREQVQGQGHTFLLAKVAGAYAGFASCQPGYKDTGKTKLHKLYVVPEAQGHGVGRFLVDAVIAIARRHGNPALLLNVNRHNEAIRFYHRLGFNVVAGEDIPIGNGFVMEDYVMEKVLAATPS